jgi:hypothetical protein
VGKRKQRKRTPFYSHDWFKPEEWLTFIEADGFLDDWKELRLNDDDLRALEVLVGMQPKGHPVIRGTGGLRKLRFASVRRAKGKSGGVRVLYVYFDEYGIVLLLAAYAKSEQDDIPESHKKAYRQFIERQKKAFASRAVK